MEGMSRVLIVEDDPGQARAIAATLRHRLPEGIAIDVEADGLEALGMLRIIRYSVVVADVSVPGMTGDKLTSTLRAILGRSRPRVVLISARSGDALAELAEACGANAWLEKPFSAEQLVVTVAELLGIDPSTLS